MQRYASLFITARIDMLQRIERGHDVAAYVGSVNHEDHAIEL